MSWNHCDFANFSSPDPFFGALWRGTMQSMLDRTREDGFCLTSFGEKNDVRAYGSCHYSRDAAEAAWVLADQGCLEPAIKILEFTLNHIPDGQYHIVHAYRPDATSLHNKIQIDTPAHPARALAKILEMGAEHAALEPLFDHLDRIFNETYAHHYQAEFHLLNSGNYNEQLGGTDDPLLDMFTNGAMHSGCLAMAQAARSLNRPDNVAKCYLDRAAELNKGIETFLYDAEHDLYRAALHADGRDCERPVNWISLYPERWYSGKRSAWRTACAQLWTHGCNRWGALSVPSGETDFMRLRTMGKVIGQLLRFSAHEKQDGQLRTLLTFLAQTIRHPSDIYPEFWLHHMPAPGESPYLDWFFSEYKSVWNGYVENPEGDYTVDSGNCEQCAVFLGCFISDVLGFSGTVSGHVEVAPRFPYGSGECSISRRALGRGKDGRFVSGSFQLSTQKLEFSADAPVTELAMEFPLYEGQKTGSFRTLPEVPCELMAHSVRAVFRNTASASITLGE